MNACHCSKFNYVVDLELTMVTVIELNFTLQFVSVILDFSLLHHFKVDCAQLLAL